MPKVAIEPPLPGGNRILSPARLPVPPLRPAGGSYPAGAGYPGPARWTDENNDSRTPAACRRAAARRERLRRTSREGLRAVGGRDEGGSAPLSRGLGRRLEAARRARRRPRLLPHVAAAAARRQDGRRVRQGAVPQAGSLLPRRDDLVRDDAGQPARGPRE